MINSLVILNTTYAKGQLTELGEQIVAARSGSVAANRTSELLTAASMGFWWGDLREGDHLGDPGIDGMIILEWIFKRWYRAWTGLSWLRIRTGGGFL
jgi:hypothetical protein